MSANPDIELVLAARLSEFIDGLSQAQESLRRSMSEMAGTAKSGADRVEQSFQRLGTRSLNDIEREIEEIEQAYQDLASSGTVTGADLVRAARAAEAQIESLRRSTDGVEESFEKLGVRSLNDVEREIGEVQQAYRRLARSGRLSASELARANQGAERRVRELRRSTNELSAAWRDTRSELVSAGVAVGATLVTLGRAAKASNEFGLGIAEVNTLLPETSDEIGIIEERSRALAREFGTLPVDQARAFYQAISAGASDASEANDILVAANKLALGGVTDITTATDGLTSVLNAYNLSTEQSTEVSDLFFTAVRDGKTTVDEISTSIGGVAPIAATTNVELSSLLGAVAALTKGGISTSEAMTQVRGILDAIVKPTAEARKVAQELGLEFDVNALKAKGFEQFLMEMVAAADGSEEALGRLLGRTEALQGVLALGGTQAASFASILEDMENAAGATEAAVKKITDSDAFRSRRFTAAIGDIQVSLGQAVTALSPVLEGVTELLNLFNTLPDPIRNSIALAATAAVTLGSLGLAASAVSGPFRALLGHVRALDVVPTVMRNASSSMLSTAAAGRVVSNALRGIPFLLLVSSITEAAIEWGNYRDAQHAATQASREAAEASRDLDERIQSIKRTHGEFADVTLKSRDEIRALTEGEFREYQRSIEQAQMLWRALLVEARRAGDTEGVEEARAKLAEYEQGLISATQAIKEILAENQELATRIGSLTEQFRALSSDADDLGESIKGALDKADDTGLRNVALALGDLASDGTSDAKLVEDALKAAFEDLDPEKVRRFGVQAQVAFDLINRSAEATNAVLKTTLNAALEELGVSTENASAKAVANFQTITQSALASGQQIEKSFVEALSRATNPADVQRLQEALNQAGQSGQVSMDAVAAGADRAAARIRQLNASTNPLSNDFQRLGVQSRQELDAIAATAEASFSRIEDAAHRGEAAQSDVREAFLAWGRAALDAAARADPATRRVIEQQVALRAATADVTDALEELGDSAEENAGRASAAAQQAAQNIQQVGSAASESTADLRGQVQLTQTAGGGLAKVIGGALDGVRELSAGASLAVDDLVTRLNMRIHGDPSTFITRLVDELGIIRTEFERQTEVADEAIAAYERTGRATAALTRAVQLTTAEMRLLDQQRLDQLQSIIRTARMEAESFTESVRSGTQSLREELARVRGDEEEVRRLQFRRRREDIQLKIQEARGNSEAIAELKEQLRLLEEIEKESGGSGGRGGGLAGPSRPRPERNNQPPPPPITDTPPPPPSPIQPSNPFGGDSRVVQVFFQSPDGLQASGQFDEQGVNNMLEILRRSGATTSV